MKKKSSLVNIRLSRHHAKAAVVSGSLTFFLTASAQSQTIYDWLDTAPDGNWKQGTSGARWNPGGFFDEPPFGVLRFNNNHELNMTNNVAGTYSTHGLIFGSLNTSTRTIGGNTIRFFDNGGVDPYISNDSTATHVINTNLEGDGTSTDPLKLYINNSGGLTFGGTINNQGSWIDVIGSSATPGTTVTFNGIISGGGGLYKNNANTVVALNAQNSYTGGTTIDAGTVNLGHATDTLANAGTVTVNGGTLGIGNNSDTVGTVIINGGSITGSTGVLTGSSYDARSGSVSAILGGAGALTKTTTGTLNLSGNNNSYTGTIAINAGTIAISNGSALGTTAGNTSIATTGSTTGGQLALIGGITSAENISITGLSETGSYQGAIVNNSGINTLSGNITLPTGASAIRITAGGGELIFGGTITRTTSVNTLVIQAGSGAAITVNNAINNNNGGLNILGFAGGAASNGVTLKGGTANNSNTNIMENGLLKLGVINALKTTASLQIGTTGSNAGFDVGTFDLAGFNQTIGALVGAKNTGGTIAPDSSRIITNSVTGTSLLTVGNGGGTGTFNGVILDGGVGKIVALTKTGTGTQTLVGDSNYSGVTTISAGTLAITHSNALGSTAGNTTIAASGNTNGGILNLSNNINSAENITITGATEQNFFSSVILNTGGTNTLSGNITMSSLTGGVRMGATAGSLTFSGNISQTGSSQGTAFIVSTGASVIVNNAIANNGAPLSIYGTLSTGTGTVTLKGVSGTGLGETSVNQTGILKLGVTDALNTSANLSLGVTTTTAGFDFGTFDLAGYNQTVNALNGNVNTSNAGANDKRKITNSAAGTGTNTLTVGNGGGTGVFNGLIQDGATAKTALTKTGIGNQTLNGSHTYTGGTLITGGTLTLGNATDTLANGGAVNVNGGTLALGANSDTVGAVTLTSGSITGSGAGTLTGTGYDVRSGSASAILAGSSVALTKTTAGIVTLSGANTYTGATAVNDGILAINGNQSTANGAVTVATGATLKGSGTVGGATTIQSGGIHNAGAHANNTPAPLAPVGTQTFSGNLSYSSQSIFAWDLGGEKDTATGTRGTDYDAVNVSGNLSAHVLDTDTDGGGPDTITPTPASDAIFRVIVSSSFDFTTVFWDAAHEWSNIFSVTGTTSGWAPGTAVGVYNYDFANNTYTPNSPTAQGTFTISGSTLNWTAVPEPSSAMAGLLIAAGLLRRRRK